MSSKHKLRQLLKNENVNFDSFRTMLIAAHPDDEVVGIGSLLRYLKNVQIVHVTDGSPRNMIDAIKSGCTSRQAYAKKRRVEMISALNLAGHKSPDCISLEFIDQEASLNLPGVSLRIVELIERMKPQLVLAHAYEGGHPDHDATAFGVWAACRMLQRENKQTPDVVEFASYHGNGSNQIITNRFIPVENTEVVEIKLSNMEQNLKKQMIECFRTQRDVISEFTVKYEQLRNAPSYDFSLLPHEGTLYYDYYHWGMSSSRWLRLANEAMRVLRLGEN